MYHGYRKQLFFAAACIRCGLRGQAQVHLKRALGIANLENREALPNIMRALNYMRRHEYV